VRGGRGEEIDKHGVIRFVIARKRDLHQKGLRHLAVVTLLCQYDADLGWWDMHTVKIAREGLEVLADAMRV
jgi:hypothetical protein